ncbi:hypothetical protein [Rhodoferax sp.]|uniref:hypothetical protein n=1 Tax=Rhodoferax sp. TaxID=50421 RepID=UPI001A10516C|nr:hypothetical protein [Rhodoferax sp.]MBE0473120.1 hypothetical protein [Rhodoferax sp.]
MQPEIMYCFAALSMKSPVIATVAVIANELKQSISPDCIDCRAALSMNSPVIANAVTQSMHPEVMDRRATLAMTRSLFKVRVRYRA